MFWIGKDKFTYYQIFTKFTFINDIYKFLMDNINTSKYKCTLITYDIFIKDDLILYKSTNSDQEILYKITENNFSHDNNKYPMFKFSYEKDNENKMPIMDKNQYDYYHNIELKIYEINKNMYYIIENNNKSYYIINDTFIDDFYNFLST